MISKKDLIYLRGLNSIEFPDLKKLKDIGIEEKIPIVDDDVGKFLYLITKLKKPKEVLEIGLGGAYSTLWIQKALAKDGRLTTLELNTDRIKKAKSVFGKVDNVNIIYQDGLEFLKESTKQYDLIFLDAVKRSYTKYLELIPKSLKTAGVLIADNILLKGYVNNSEDVNDKYIAAALAIREFNERLSKLEFFDSMFLPIGDGLSFSVKKNTHKSLKA